MSEATFYLVKALLDVFTIGIILNFYFRLLRADYYNPIVQGIIRAVDYPSQVLRSLIKPMWGLDISTLIVAILVQSSAFFIAVTAGAIEYNPLNILLWSIYSVFLLIFKIAWWIMLAGIVLSWIATTNMHPAIVLIRQLSDQIFRPFRVFLPPMGGLDFSPILAFIVLNFLQIAFSQYAIESGLPRWLSVGF
tara:strand:+ start:75630 stop:76205 length:576 start_codon:yes stop_codon:yes gene_type:complete